MSDQTTDVQPPERIPTMQRILDNPFILLFIGTVFYSSVEGLKTVDAFYLAGSTLTTLGYGDFVPRTDAGKVFTVIYALAGIGTIFYIMGRLGQAFFERAQTYTFFHGRKLNKINPKESRKK